MDQAAAKAGQGAPRCALPAAVGVGFKPQHFAAIEAAGAGAVAFFEVHAENYFVAGGPLLHQLDWLAARYPLSIHGVGASLAGPHPPLEEHLPALSALLARTAAASFSEHLAWSSAGGMFLDDLLPVPYDGATLRRLCAHVERVQERLGRRPLLENPATYVEFSASTWSEPEFLAEVVRRTGRGLLLDLTTCTSPASTTIAIPSRNWSASPWRQWRRSTWRDTPRTGTMQAIHCSSTATTARWRSRFGRCTRRSSTTSDPCPP